MAINARLQYLIDQTYICTNRPDLVDETKQFVISSTMKMHGIDFFPRDMTSADVVFDIEAYLQTLDIQSIPRFRNTAYVRKWDPRYNSYQQDHNLLPPLYNSTFGFPVSQNQAICFLDEITPDYIFDSYGCEKFNVYYQLGGTLMMKSNTSLKQVKLGWYQYPILTDELYNSWIADNYPFAIIYDAASSLLQTIGQQDVARKYDNPDPNNSGLVASHLYNLRMSNIVVKGY